MTRIRLASLALVALAATACVTPQQELAQGQEQAVVTAVRRGQFELSCPTAAGTVLSETMLQPIAWRGIERAEYTIGVAGCGKKASYIVICPTDGYGCVAGASRTDAPMQ
jgi:hypothetical protein